jgi:hypothetical protein
VIHGRNAKPGRGERKGRISGSTSRGSEWWERGGTLVVFIGYWSMCAIEVEGTERLELRGDNGTTPPDGTVVLIRNSGNSCSIMKMTRTRRGTSRMAVLNTVVPGHLMVI